MDNYQKLYMGFMESICRQFNCPNAILPLREGFKAYCESVDGILMESATPTLYHFLSCDRLLSIIKTNRFTPNNSEHEYIGKGNRFMSFSRTGSLDEGFATLYASGDDGKSDEWCLIRLTIDGDRFNTHPNYHVGDKENKRLHSIKVRPFDWTTHEIRKGEFNYMNPTGADSSKGMQIASDDDGHTDTIIPVPDNVYLDRYSHPFVQSEDRLITDGEYIPNAVDFIKRIDMLILPYAFNDGNLEERKEFVNTINAMRQWSRLLHVYLTKETFDRKVNEQPDWLIAFSQERLADYLEHEHPELTDSLVDVRKFRVHGNKRSIEDYDDWNFI